MVMNNNVFITCFSHDCLKNPFYSRRDGEIIRDPRRNVEICCDPRRNAEISCGPEGTLKSISEKERRNLCDPRSVIREGTLKQL